MKRSLFLALALCLLVLAGAEAWLHRHLFQHVSYSNSASIDAQLRERDSGPRWRMLFVGDSEVHWGVDPEQVDAGFRDAGRETLAFNHAFDGFGASWWPSLLPGLLEAPALREVDTVVVGVQLTDYLRLMRPSGEDCGGLQRPVLTSPFAVDLHADGLCRTRTWDAQLGRDLFGGLWTVRYASAVRTLLLPQAFFSSPHLALNSRSDGPPRRGFQPHRTLAQDKASYESEFRRWKAQFDPERDFQPIAPGAWQKLVVDGGFFDALQQTVERSGRRLALYAVPTNPVVIDTFHRRANYAENSALLAAWAARRGVVFVDLGLQDRPDADQYFSDMRHLSGVGARDFSRRLGRALAQPTPVRGPEARDGR